MKGKSSFSGSKLKIFPRPLSFTQFEFDYIVNDDKLMPINEILEAFIRTIDYMAVSVNDSGEDDRIIKSLSDLEDFEIGDFVEAIVYLMSEHLGAVYFGDPDFSIEDYEDTDGYRLDPIYNNTVNFIIRFVSHDFFWKFYEAVYRFSERINEVDRPDRIMLEKRKVLVSYGRAS